ncbi:MAG TPA: response regulator [Blastocatellia bacterium]|nr:response regulator [Blastocatellia bacterium]
MQSINKRILYIDDNKDSREMITALLSFWSYEVVQAGTFAEAMEKVSSDGFDLCLLDNWLPDGSGIELCRQIRSIKPHMPIVFYSGVAGESDKEAAFRAGAQAYLVKPTGIEVIEQTINGLLDGNGAKRDGQPGEVKAAGQPWVEISRRRIERSRQLAKEARERLRVSDTKIEQTLSKQSQGKR